MKRFSLIALTLVAAGGSRAAPPTPKADILASTLFTYTFDFERDAQWQKRHSEAIRYVHSRSKDELSRELRDVLRRRGLTTRSGAGAAYLMALHGIDAERNLHLLVQAHQHTSESVEDSLPDALADIAIRNRSLEAARSLVAMPNGEYDCEMQSIAIHRLFLAAPDLVVSSVADSPSLTKYFLELLPFGAWNAQGSMDNARRVAARMEARSTGAKRAIYRRVASMKEPRI